MIHASSARFSAEPPPQAAAAPEPAAAVRSQADVISAPETVQTRIIRGAANKEAAGLDQMIDQVYDQLERRLKFDRRRTGLM
jgi:hypothetical protein